jgi:hypothetical protein
MTKIIKHQSILLFSLFALSVMLIGCEKSTDQPDDKYTGKANGLRNGELWNAECKAIISSSYPNELYLYIDRYNEYKERREAIVVARIEMNEGVFNIVNGLALSPKPNYSSHYASFVADGDAIDGEYLVLETDSNYLEITKIDLGTKDFFGSFNVAFLKDTTFNINPNLPDTLWFTEVEFQTKIQESW